ncbi:hypothetical protein FQN60_005972 [Etheostoma spectabile]|uniref:Uncharacterized protein n=1 Tax=Etheostoma spectabile TaxID=54343 RepID=A0A5J5CF80_9PERO|nr:hypothetical protein FQN60_005972 [Etheostoma spectabile]
MHPGHIRFWHLSRSQSSSAAVSEMMELCDGELGRMLPPGDGEGTSDADTSRFLDRFFCSLITFCLGCGGQLLSMRMGSKVTSISSSLADVSWNHVINNSLYLREFKDLHGVDEGTLEGTLHMDINNRILRLGIPEASPYSDHLSENTVKKDGRIDHAVGVCKKLVSHLSHSWKARDALAKVQKELNLPSHSLISECQTR